MDCRSNGEGAETGIKTALDAHFASKVLGWNTIELCGVKGSSSLGMTTYALLRDALANI